MVAEQVKKAFESGHGLTLQPDQVKELVSTMQGLMNQAGGVAMRLDSLQRLTIALLRLTQDDEIGPTQFSTEFLEMVQEGYAGFDVEVSEDGKIVTLTLIPEEVGDAEVEATLSNPDAGELVQAPGEDGIPKDEGGGADSESA